VEGVAPHQPFSSQKTRINVLSYGIQTWTDLSSVLSGITHVTDRQTEVSSLYRVCITRSAVKIINDLHCVFAATGVIKISTDNWILGVTLVDDELFVLLFPRDDNQVCVYSINDYQQRRHLNVPRYEPDDSSDMTSCVRHKCLYMSDLDNSCIHRYQLASTLTDKIKRVVRSARYELASSATSKWSVPGNPRGLSVTPRGNLLVTCWEPNKLVELSVDSGKCVREIALQSDIECPRHSVQLTTGQFVVSHGVSDSGLHRVCVVGDDGKVTRSYGGQPGSDVGQLDCPCHLAVDKDSQFIFVADQCNKRVVLLSPTLEFVRYIEGLSLPQRLYFHPATDVCL